MSNVKEVPEVPVPHAETAFRLLESLRAMQASIDGFVMPPMPLDARKRPRGYALLPTPFFIALAVALESSPLLIAALQAAGVALTPAIVRDMLRHGEAYLSVAEEMERFARGIRHSVALRRGNVGRLAAAAYRVAQELNLLGDVSLPIPEVETMKRAVTSRRRKGAELDPAVKAKASP